MSSPRPHFWWAHRLRWATFGLRFGAVATFTLGCHAIDTSTPVPSAEPQTRLYPGVPVSPPLANPLVKGVMAEPLSVTAPARPNTTTSPVLPRVGPVPYSVAAAGDGRSVAFIRPVDRARAAVGLPCHVSTAAAVEPTAGPRDQAGSAMAADPSDWQVGPVETILPGPRQTLDLEVALRLAGVDNPTINLAQEQVREALAGQLAARSLLLPNINIGGNYRYHSGPLQDDPGELLHPTLQSLNLGFGAGAVGTNPAAFPGIRLFAHLGDAVYEPLAARQRVSGSRSFAQATRNSILLDVATAYLELVGAETRLEILRRAKSDIAEIARVTAAFAKTGQGVDSDAHRAAANADLILRQIRQAEGETQIASARLCSLLNLDPSMRLGTPGGPVEPIGLVPETSDLESLVTEAARSRPELGARLAEILEAQTRVRQERARPLLPTFSIGYSADLFGGGSNQNTPEFGPLRGRSDFDVVAVWSIQNLGLGNGARVRRAKAGVGVAVAEYDAALNQIRREVAEALAMTQAAARQITITRISLSAAEEGFQLENERIRQGQGRPIEVLDSFRQLVDARLDYLGAVIAFDIAQFQLFVALGRNPASDSHASRPGIGTGSPPAPALPGQP